MTGAVPGGAPMKIVHVITDLNQGGAQAMLEKLVLFSRSPGSSPWRAGSGQGR